MGKNLPSLQLYRTTELSSQQIESMCSLFENTFHHSKTPKQFLRQFTNTGFSKGSYHILEEIDGEVVSMISFIPYRYMIKGAIKTAVLGGDSIVTAKTRLGIGCLLEMYKMAAKQLTAEGFSFLYGIPNNNLYEYDKKVVRMLEVCTLDFYVLPINLAKLKRVFTLIQWLYYPCVQLFLHFMSVLVSRKTVSFAIEKIDDEQFRNQRYDERHQRVRIDEKTDAFYSLYQEGNTPVAYIVDITPFSQQSFYKAFIKIASLTKKEVALIAYPANRLPFFTPLRVPQRFLPRKLRVVLQDYNDPKSDFLTNPKEWNFNLSNIDVR